MIPARRASRTNDLVSSGAPFTLPSRSTPKSHSHNNHDNPFYCPPNEPTYAEFLSSNDDWLDPYSLDPSESSSSQRRKRSTTCGLESDIVYTTSLRPRAKSLRDGKATSSNFETTSKGAMEKVPTKHTHPARARSRILKSPPPPPALEMDQPSLPNVDVQQIKDELSASVSAPRRQKSLQHHQLDLSKETASVISNVKRKLSLKDRVDTDKSSLYDGRKSQTPSLAERSSYPRRRSIYSPPLRTTRHQKKDSDGWTTSDDDGRLSSTSTSSGTYNYDYGIIPPVPPVPKHHSIRTPNDDDDIILATLTAGSTQSNNSGRGTFGSFEEILQQQVDSNRTKSRTPKHQLDNLSPSLLPTRTSSKKTNDNRAEKVVNRKRGRTLPGSLATPPPIPVMPLPPMKLEPIHITLPANPRPQRLSSSRIPKPPSALSTRSGSSSNNTPTKNIINYASSEDEGMIHRSNRNKSSLKGSYSTTLTPPLTAEQQRRSLKASSASPKISPKPSPKSSPKMKHSRSASSSIGAASPLSSSLQRKLSRNAKTPNEPVPKLPTAITTSDIKTPRQQSNSVAGTLNRTTSLHSGRTESKEKSGRKDRTRTFSLHDKIQSTIAPEPEFIMLNPKPQAPIRTAKSPQTALKYYAQYLTSYEQAEILDFHHIYFIGPHAKKIQGTTTVHDHHHHRSQNPPATNSGYDDENGDYKIVRQDHLMYRYEILDVLGQGSFGQVVKCFDHKTGDTVAIKLIRNKKRFHAQALTEIKILQNLLDWDPEDKHHTIKMTDYFYFRHHLCIAFECMSMNLYEFIKKNNFMGFSLGLIRKFSIQILHSLILLYQHRVVHCDLKPENILLKHPGKSTIKVIDFGSSCLETERVYTYIQSRFYRSPEVILGISYNMAIDMWSVGCILAELHTGIPLFPGESEQEQLGCIMEVLGLPDRYLIDQSSRKKLFFDSQGNARTVVNSKGKRRQPGTKSLAQALKTNDSQFIDFVQGCLLWDPANRMTPMEAMNHEWIQQRPPSNIPPQKLDESRSRRPPKMTASYYQSFRKHSVG